MTRSFGKSNRSPGSAASDTKIRNVGPKSAAWLRQVGVRSTADVKRLGALECFLKVKRAGFKATLNLLYALAGAEDECHWQDLAPERKEALLRAFEAAEAELPSDPKKRWAQKQSTLGAKIVDQALGPSERDGDGGEDG